MDHTYSYYDFLVQILVWVPDTATDLCVDILSFWDIKVEYIVYSYLIYIYFSSLMTNRYILYYSVFS